MIEERYKMHKFGIKSESKLSTCHVWLQKILRLALTRSRIDFGIAYGKRSDEEQYKMYQEGKSQCDGKIKKSKHQVQYPEDLSDAADIYLWHPDEELRKKMNNDFSNLSYVAGVIVCCSEELREKGEID